MSFSNNDIQRWTYDNAQKYGIGSGQLEGALGLGAGSVNQWAQSQGLGALNGANNYSNQDIQRFIYDGAQKYGIGANQLDSAFGWNAGTASGWAGQNNLGGWNQSAASGQNQSGTSSAGQ